MGHAAQSTFSEWTNGSGFFFWRWPRECQLDVALGQSPQWVAIREDCNYPGLPGYRPARPWISKRTKDDLIACEVLDYVDDNRTTGPDYESVWRASTNLAKGYSYLGIQDAMRKRRSPTTELSLHT